MDVDPDTFLTTVYDAVATFCADHPEPPHRGRPPRMSDAEVLTVVVLGRWHPIGVVFGLREAWRLAGPKMALLMAAMLAVVGGLVWWTVRRIRQERKESD